MSGNYYLENGTSVSTEDAWYNINREVGEGGNCVVYLVTQTDGEFKGNNFALKIFKNVWDETREDRFRDEQAFLEETDHPSILRYYDQDEYNGYPFLVSEYLPKNLREVLNDEPLPLTVKLSYAVQLLSVLVHLEQEEPPIIHRDIKPENIFVRGETCYLGDFGLLKRKGTEADEQMRSFYRSDDVAMNKYLYRTPDLVAYEREEMDQIPVESDVFQLGLVLIELFTENNWNPQVPTEKPLSDVEIHPRAYEYIRIPEGMGNGIGNLLSDMIAMDHSERPKASELMDNWMGIFSDAAEKSQDLHGRVF